jgi:hypothetical protein
MKKIYIKRALSVFLTLFVVACNSNKNTQPARDYQRTQPAPEPSTRVIEREVPVENAKFSDADLSCQSDKDCALIPREGCLGCMEEGGGHTAINMEGARRIMMSRRAECEPKIKELRQNGQGSKPPKTSSDPSCTTNGAGCENGQCVAKKLSEAELKQRMEEMQRAQGGQQGGPQRGPQGGQGPQRQPQGPSEEEGGDEGAPEGRPEREGSDEGAPEGQPEREGGDVPEGSSDRRGRAPRGGY